LGHVHNFDMFLCTHLSNGVAGRIVARYHMANCQLYVAADVNRYGYACRTVRQHARRPRPVSGLTSYRAMYSIKV